MGQEMDTQTAHTIIQVLRQKLADSEWQNTLLQAEVIRLTNAGSERDEKQDSPD